MTRVLVLGGSGMLGGMVAGVLSREENVSVTATARDLLADRRARSPRCGWEPLDVESTSETDLEALLRGADWVINAVGVIKSQIRDTDPGDVERAVRVNALFPHVLARAAARCGARVIQIATDCVYSGARGGYVESDRHDALDVYGKTKSLGEVPNEAVHNLRCSIVGPESRGHRSLLDWFRLQPARATVPGYVNHRWNGVTTLAFARLCLGIIREGAPQRIHVIPADQVDKAELLGLVREAYSRQDVTIAPEKTPIAIDRTLATEHPAENRALWRAAGYAAIPTIPEMVREMAAFDARLGGTA